MAKMFNRARMTVTSTGTGALSLGVAVAGYQTFSSAGAQNGDSVSYAVEDGLKWEIGTGTYNSVAGTLSRTVTQSFDGTTYGTSPISVTTSAQVFISPLAADLQYGTSAGNLVQLDGSARLPAVDGSLVTALNASNISSGTIAAARVPTLNQNTTGTAANVTGTVAVANGGTGLTSLTAGYIPFGGSTTYSSDSNLFWDNTNKRLGVGTATPTAVLSVFSASASPTSVANGVRFLESTNGYGLNLGGSSTGYAWIQGVYGGSSTLGYNNISIQPNGGSVGIGTTSPGAKFQVKAATNQNFQVSGSVSFANSVCFSGVNDASSANIPIEFRGNGFAWYNAGSFAAQLDTVGNLGLGVAPSAWGSGYKAIEGNYGTSFTFDTNNPAAIATTNAYHNGTNWIYKINSYGAMRLSTEANGGFKFFTAPSGTAGNPITFTQAMTLDASGNLGIGTSSPGYKLHVSSVSDMSGRFETTGTTNAASFYLASGNGTTSGKYAYARFLNNDTNQQEWRLGTYGDNNLQIVGGTSLTSFSTKLTLDTSGNLGLGVTPSVWASPFTKAFEIGTVGSIATTTNSLRFANNAYYGSLGWTYKNTAAAAHYDIIDNTHSWYNANSGTAGTAITFTQAMTLDGSGNLGVGTGAGAIGSKLQVIGSTNIQGGTFQVGTLGGGRYFSVSSIGNTTLRYDDNSAASNLVLQNLGVTASDQGNQLIAQFGSDAVNSYPGCIIRFGTSGLYTSTVSTQNSYIYFGTTSNGNLSERMRINSSGLVVLQGGTTTATGTGIAFPATQSASSDANTLDDYEEGFFTFTDQSAAGLTITTNGSGNRNQYIKIGSLVFVSGSVTYPTTSNSNQLAISLPFTPLSGSYYAGGGFITFSDRTATKYYLITIENAAAKFYVMDGGSNTSNADFSGKRLDFELVYRTTT